TGGNGFTLVLTLTDIVLGQFVEVRRQLTGQTTLQLSGQLRILLGISLLQLIPFCLKLGTLGARVPSLVDLVFNHKRFVLPLQVGTSGADLIIAQGCTVALFLTLFVRRAVADDGLAANDGRLGGVGAGLLNGG